MNLKSSWSYLTIRQILNEDWWNPPWISFLDILLNEVQNNAWRFTIQVLEPPEGYTLDTIFFNMFDKNPLSRPKFPASEYHLTVNSKQRYQPARLPSGRKKERKWLVYILWMDQSAFISTEKSPGQTCPTGRLKNVRILWTIPSADSYQVILAISLASIAFKAYVACNIMQDLLCVMGKNTLLISERSAKKNTPSA